MSYAVEPLLFEQFKGIREFNGVNTPPALSATTCSNVELFQTETGSNTGIKSMNGNKSAYALDEGYSVIGIFKSSQNGVDYKFIYGETEEKGTLYYINLSDNPEVLVDDLTVTGNCNGLTMSSTAYDVFVFTNGVEAKTVCFTGDTGYEDVIADHNPVSFDGGYIADIDAVDYQERTINWLAMTEWNGFLVVASQYGVHSSHQNDIYTWNDNPDDIADSWYIDFSKTITAVYVFTGGLYIFTDNDCTLLNTTPNDTDNATMITSAGIGCFSYQSITKHDLYLFFYDNNQKNVYYLSVTDTTGQIRPNGPVAKEVQSHFTGVESFKMYSCVHNTKNEIWCLIDDEVLIYDYAQQEWLKREEQTLNTLMLVNNTIYTGDELGNVYAENVNTDFSGTFYPSVYQTTIINAGSNSNMKKQKTPLLLTLNPDYINNFWVQLTVDNKQKNAKKVYLRTNSTGVYTTDDATDTSWYEQYDSAQYCEENSYKRSVVEISTPQTWYTLGIKIYTDELGQGFCITSAELKNIKVKTKTRGR